MELKFLAQVALGLIGMIVIVGITGQFLHKLNIPTAERQVSWEWESPDTDTEPPPRPEPEPEPYEVLREAIKCSYYRCKEGCVSAIEEVDSGSIEEVDSGSFSCYKYCKSEWRDNNGKICDDRAKIHPVEVETEESAPMSFDTLDFIHGCPPSNDLLKPRFCCMVLENDLNKVKNYAGIHWMPSSLSKDLIGKECTWTPDITYASCNGLKKDCGVESLELDSSKYFIWTLSGGGTAAWGSNVVWYDKVGKKRIIEPDKWTELEVKLEGDAFSKSKFNRIIVKSGEDIINESFLKKNEGPGPKILFSCTEKNYMNKEISVDETLVCGRFLLTFKEYRGNNPLVENIAVFDVKYSSTPISCGDYDNNKNVCNDIGCNWCSKCNPSPDGNEVNSFGENRCLEDPEACVYERDNCDKDLCGGCEDDNDCQNNEACENCQCVPKYCCSYLSDWYCVTNTQCESMRGNKWDVSCTDANSCEDL